MAKKFKARKLPIPQLFVLSICRFAEPIALTSVFPYLPEMIESFNVPKDAVSKWAGIASAVFSLSQAVTGVLWGRASDRYGRKPVILCAMYVLSRLPPPNDACSLASGLTYDDDFCYRLVNLNPLSHGK